MRHEAGSGRIGLEAQVMPREVPAELQIILLDLLKDVFFHGRHLPPDEIEVHSTRLERARARYAA